MATGIVVNGGTMQMYGATTSITVESGGVEVVNSGIDSAAQILGGAPEYPCRPPRR